MFNIGDLVTGKARSFERSIYRFVLPIDDLIGDYEIVSCKWQTDFERFQKRYTREHHEFRLATKMETLTSSTKSHHRLFDLLADLKIIRIEYY